MTKLLVLNGKSYRAAEFDTNTLCDFEENGIALDQIDKKMFSVIRMYVAVSANVDVKTAGNLITEHISNGGEIDDITDVMSEMMESSGFFRGKQENENTESQPRTRKKRTAQTEE